MKNSSNKAGSLAAMPGTDRFMEMWHKWAEVVPSTLAGEEPPLLLHLLTYADLDAGISQRSLQGALKVHQARLSKLMLKLRAEGWLIDIRENGGDGRVRLVQTTRAAKVAVGKLNDAWQPVVTTSSRRRFKKPDQIGSFFS